MDWTYPAGAGPEGIFEMGRRLAESVGRIPDATTFIDDPREMLRVTRRVERLARGGRLLVGFQKAAKLEAEAARYHALAATGTRITAFASDRPSTQLEGIEYREVPPARLPLANQWFLVSDDPLPIAFVSWEISDPRLFGMGGGATSGKRFVGFVSDDPSVVTSLVMELGSVGAAGPGGRRAVDADQPRRQALQASVEATHAPRVQAAEGAVIIVNGRGADDPALALAIAVARAEGRRLVIVDRSGERIFGNPYSELRGGDALRPRPDRLFDAAIARREGRLETAIALEVASGLRCDAGAWFPTPSGIAGLREAVRRFGGSILVVPASIREPSAGERARGMTLDELERLGLPVLVADADRHADGREAGPRA